MVHSHLGYRFELEKSGVPTQAIFNFSREKSAFIALGFLKIGITSARMPVFLLAAFALAVLPALPLPQDDKVSHGSPYVPLDSWVYPTLRRLAALGYIKGQVADTAPWTRAECFRQTAEAAATETFNRSFYVQDSSDKECIRLSPIFRLSSQEKNQPRRFV